MNRIIKIISNDYTVEFDNKEKRVCKARGVFRNKNITPLAGDFCLVNSDNIIEEILDRKNSLNRPPVANIDIAMVVTSIVNPDFSSKLLDKLLTVIEYNNIEPVICFTKLDLSDLDITSLREYYESIGYKVVTNEELDKIKEIIKGKTVILTGQSGAGKSSLLNRLDSSLDLKTDEISKALNRGKHTTRNIEFYELCDSYVADTPGFSKLDFADMTKENIRDSFVEFNNYECKYSDCMHIKEEGCKVKEAVDNKEIIISRYENYISFINEKENER
ncbi:MAG: ribosome small subunit-dependent GTPase A [Bacilli bacterium]|nr:ribosome small subunit-dependent GTPase A [Bacilli bacterium]